MRAHTHRHDVISQLETGRDRIREAIDGLSADQLTEPTLDGWSVRDHLNHLTIMHEFRFFEISRVARLGTAIFQPQSDSQMDSLNALLGSWRKDLPVKQALSDLEFAWALLLDTVANVEEDALDPSKYLEVGPEGGAIHDQEHAETIVAWRAARGY